MNNKKQRCIHIVLAMFLLSSVLVSSGCTSSQQDSNDEHETVVHTFTCPMHPQIVQDKPGTCPLCSMDLVPFDRTTEGEALYIDETRKALANITVMTVGQGVISSHKILNGRLTVNPEQINYISSRVAGRVDRLFVRELGVRVKKGQALYAVYSEELSILQQEFLLAIAQAKEFPNDSKFAQIAEAAKKKLRLYDQSVAQIQALTANQKLDPLVTVFASQEGIVAELSITEGQYVEQGSPILVLQDYNTIWVEADLYPHEVKQIQLGQELRVEIAGWESSPQTLKIQFINPALQSASQLLQIRGSIVNPNGQWQVGQQATLFLPNNSESDGINLPLNAVIRTGSSSHVWVENQDNRFEARRVKTGIENSDQVEILEGLLPGERVVVTGAYLVNSEYILKKGSEPMTMHTH